MCSAIGGDLAHVGAARAGARSAVASSRQGAVHDQIGVTPDRAGEMSVIVFGETVVAERLRRITGALQAFQKADLERLLLRLCRRDEASRRCNSARLVRSPAL